MSDLILKKCDPKVLDSCVTYRTKYREATNRLDQYVDKETANEKKVLEAAMKAYEDKVESLSKTKEFKKMEDEVIS
jgi:DNA-binding transcriptional regulator WhiA